MKTRKFGDEDPLSGKKWGGSPSTHIRHLKRAVAEGRVDIPCGSCSACCRSGVAIYDDDGSELPKAADGSCIHLQPDGNCGRYETRPEHCRMFTCTTFSIAGVVTDNAVMNEALAQWEWDLSSAEDRALAERARENERRITIKEMLAGDDN